MNSQFDQTVLSSFYLWFENHLLAEKAKAYSTDMDNAFQYVDFPDIPSSHVGYQGKFRQLVGDHGVDQANSGFFHSRGVMLEQIISKAFPGDPPFFSQVRV